VGLSKIGHNLENQIPPNLKLAKDENNKSST
jgi:hypothetical protein